MKDQFTERQKELLRTIYGYLRGEGYPPTLEEMRKKLKVSSNQSVLDLLSKLESKKAIKREGGIARSIRIMPLGYKLIEKSPLVAFLGVSAAGVSLETVDIQGEWREVAPDVAKLVHDVFLLKISGDSMINAGIENGDVVLVKSHNEFVSGDVVYAQIGDSATVKRFVSEDKPPYVYLKPENPKYANIPFTDETELRGKVISVLKSGYWKSVK